MKILELLRRLKTISKRNLFYVHRFLQKAGIYFTPLHYYTAGVNLLMLEKKKDLWLKKSNLIGIETNIKDQIFNLEKICLSFQNEYVGNKTYKEASEQGYGPGYGYLEAQALHGAVRFFKPQRIIEVGSGVSTSCMLAALEKNFQETGNKGYLTCVEPYPSQKLKEMSQKGRIELVQTFAQETDFSSYQKLQKNDLLFIDSSHVVKPGSDVNFLILEVLPRLAPGVIVHFHDIHFPYDFPRDTFKTFIHGNETALLHAFLIHNNRVKILFCMSQLHYGAKDALKKVFPEYIPQQDENGLRLNHVKPFEPPQGHFPSAIYFQML